MDELTRSGVAAVSVFSDRGYLFNQPTQWRRVCEMTTYTQIPPDIESMIGKLKDSWLKCILLDPKELSLHLEFALTGQNRGEIDLKLSNTVQVSVSRTPNEESGHWYVFEARLVAVLDGGLQVLKSLGHGFRKSTEALDLPFTYPETKLFHFHLEGQVCMDVVCAEYQVMSGGGGTL